MVTLFTTRPRDAETKQIVAEAKTLASLDAAEEAWHEAQPEPPKPVIIEHPIDPGLQPGASQLLGGAMEIKTPWKRD